MEEGTKVICISENFPLWKTTKEDKTEIGSHPINHPKKDEVLIVDEVLGDFLRFEAYDTVDEYKWWHKNRFRIVDDLDVIQRETSEMSVNVLQKNVLEMETI